jgi:hypothetical protein
MRVLLRRGSALATAALLLGALTACSSPAPPQAISTARFDTRIRAALTNCGLQPGDPGVTLGTDGRLALRPEAGGHPTSVTVVTAECVLEGLGIPRAHRAEFTSDSVRGGFAGAGWNSILASWFFQDTLDFKVDVVRAT